MKKTLIALFGISVFAGGGYLLWAKTPIGKKTLSKWLLKKWNEVGKKKGRKLDDKKLEKELEKLTYSDHELLSLYTYLNPMDKEDKGQLKGKVKQRFERYYKKMHDTKLLKRADLSSLENIVLPG